jgi:hypothetical protein
MTDFFLRRFFLFHLIIRRSYFLLWIVLWFLVFILILLRDVSNVYLLFLIFFFVVAFSFETANVFAVLYLRRYYEGFRCRLRPPAVCILYKPRESAPPELQFLGGAVYEGLFFTAAFINDEESWQHELQHIRDAPIFSALRYMFFALMLTVLHMTAFLRTINEIIYTLFFSAGVTLVLRKYIAEFRAYRREGVSLPEALERIENAAKVTGGLTRNITFYIVVIALTVYIVSITIDNLPYSAVAVAGGSALVFALVLRWALGVFTRRLFGINVGDFLFSSFVAGAVFHPLLGLLSTFLFSWAMFGKAKDAAVAAAVAALSLFAVLLPGLVWTSVFLL